MDPEPSPETGRWSDLTIAVDECAGDRERALLATGIWVDPMLVACPDCGGPLVRVAQRDLCTGSGPVTETLSEAYYRIGSQPGTDVMYRAHDSRRCWRERLGRRYMNGLSNT